ncbi:MAG: MBL fold metallo-hydrolase [Eubacteriales bacterium]|jgi:metallo-beta-lactamase class B
MASKYATPPGYFRNLYEHPADYYCKPFRIFGNLWYVGNTVVSCHLIDTGDGLILIDTAFSQTTALLIQAIWEAGFSPYDIRYILHTHGHMDHFGGTVFLKKLTRATTFLPRKDAEMFRTRPELSFVQDCQPGYTELFTPDVLLEDGDTVTLGNTTVRCVETPGHSPGVMSFFFSVTDGQQSLSAGLLGGGGLNTLNADFFRQFSLDGASIRAQYVAGMARLRQESPCIALGGHPYYNKTLHKRQQMLHHPEVGNLFVNPKEWPQMIDRLEADFQRMVREEQEF